MATLERPLRHRRFVSQPVPGHVLDLARLRGEKLIADEASTAESRLLAAASHDLRQPVHPFPLLVAALSPRANDSEARRLLDHVDCSVRAMGGLLDGQLDLPGPNAPRLDRTRPLQ